MDYTKKLHTYLLDFIQNSEQDIPHLDIILDNLILNILLRRNFSNKVNSEYIIKLTKEGHSKFIDNSIPFDTELEYLHFQLFGGVSENNISCNELILVKDNESTTLVNSDKEEQKKIDYLLDKASEFVLLILKAYETKTHSSG
ncbi:hypothetical protein KC669_01020 [Candidatus Dojkabacteria bacterium]|uniref:Uncharacterized protein n=1 Tax=Candidatus Dojkabacteria bacterium TaxID=2099670 RepID=A0A955RLR6_9BACT|nr:hypothetical protein [Candidatus Dojkabacteria bacterium]